MTVHALIVGISKYSLPNSNLPGSVPDALRFAEWLKPKIDPKNIQLLLSPLDDDKESSAQIKEVGIPYQPAEKAYLDAYLDKNFPSGDLFIFYWSGHGVVDKKNERYLFFSDTTEKTLNYHLDVNNTLSFLRGKKFPQQTGFIDACARSVGWDLGETKRTIHLGAAQQAYLFAASPGQAAADFKTRRTSKFSAQLLEVLKKSEQFPQNASTVIQEMRRRFAADPEQRPQYFAFKDYDSEEAILGFRPSSEYVQTVANGNGIPMQGLRRLADTAARGGQLSRMEIRDQLFAELQAKALHYNLARPEFFRLDAADDLLHIFAGAVDRGIVPELCEALNRLDAESLSARRVLDVLPQIGEAVQLTKSISVRDALPAFYRTMTSPPPVTEWDSVSWMIWSLVDSLQLLAPVAEFVVRLGNQVDNDLRETLIAWARRYFDEGNIDSIAQEAEMLPAFLFVDIERDEATADDRVSAFLQRGSRTIFTWRARESKSAKLDKVIDEITFEAEKLVKGFFVQLLVSREMFHWSAHTIQVDDEPLGTYFPVALRWRERIHQLPRTRYDDWIDRARQLREHLEKKGCPGCRWYEVEKQAFTEGDPGLIAFLEPDFDVIRKSIKDGASFAAWPLASPADAAALRSAVTDLSACAMGFDQLPHELKKRRKDKAAPDLTLFWDDPQHLKAWKLKEP